MAQVRETKSAFGIPLIVGAIGFGLAAALMSFIYLKSEKAALLEKYAGANRKEVTVLVAAKDLPKAVSDAVAKRYPKATLKEIMEETEVKGKDEKLSTSFLSAVSRTTS